MGSMLRGSRILGALVLGLSASAQSPADDLRALSEEVECRSEAHPQSRRIFSCATRKNYLADTPYKREAIADLFVEINEEHLLVKRALEIVVAATELNAQGKAILWEELAAHLQSRLGHPISQSFRGLHDEHPIYIFQGSKRFEGDKAYLLVVSESAGLYSGLIEPIENICEWLARFGDLKTLFSADAV